MKIGDKVIRIAGWHKSGMAIGDCATVKRIVKEGYLGRDYIELNEYPGRHNADNFLKTEIEIEEPKRDFRNAKAEELKKVIANSLTEKIREEELRRLLKEREALDKKIEEFKNAKVELNSDLIIKRIMDESETLDFRFFRQNNNTICELSENRPSKLSCKGVANCMPCDKYNEGVGSKLALFRALSTYYRKKTNELIKKTY